MPILETKFLALTAAFRFIVFGLMVAGLIVRLSAQHRSMDEIVRPVVRAVTITALLASQAWWFPMLEDTIRYSANYIDPHYNDNPTRVADEIREQSAPNPDGNAFSWTKMVSSIFHAFTDAVSWLFIQVATLLTVPFVFLQYVLKWILYFLTPFALGCFMIPTLVPMAVRFFQQLLAILSWPVGFALTNVITLSIWQDYRTFLGSTLTGKIASEEWVFLSQPGLLAASLTLIIGIISTPIVCNMLFSSGAALTGASSSPVAVMRGASEAIGRTVGVASGVGAVGHAATQAASMLGHFGGGYASAPPTPPPFVQPPGL